MKLTASTLEGEAAQQQVQIPAASLHPDALLLCLLCLFSSSPPLIESLWRSERRASAAAQLSGWTKPRSGLEQGV